MQGRKTTKKSNNKLSRLTKSEQAPYAIYRLDSWEAFLDMITDSPLANWAFRGQRDATWPLLSALSRYLQTFGIHPQAWQAQEARILRIFKRVFPAHYGERRTISEVIGVFAL